MDDNNTQGGMEMNISKVVKDLNTGITKRQHIRSVLTDHRYAIEDSGFDIWGGYMGDDYHIGIDSMDQLTSARRLARLLFGSWADTLAKVFPNGGGGVTAQWVDDRFPIYIQMAWVDYKDFPKELLPDEGCEFKEVENTGKSVTLSCPTG